MCKFALVGPVTSSDLLIILILVLVLFGPRKLPEIAEAFGKSIQKFKKASRDVQDEIKTNVEDDKKGTQNKN